MLSLLVSLSMAQTANPYLVTARSLVRDLKFADAIVQLEIARQVPDLDRQQRVETLELLAKCQVAEGNREKAEGAMSELLSLRPEHELDRATTSPKIVELFDGVKRRLFPDQKVSVVEERAPPGRVRMRLVDPFHRVARIELRTQTGEAGWVATEASVSDGVVDLPTPSPDREPVRWFVQVLDAQRQPLATLATEAEPRVVTKLATEPEPIAPDPRPKKFLLAGILTGIAALAVLAGATFFEVNSQALDRASRDRTRPPGDWADTARAAHGQAVSQANWALGLFIAGGLTSAAAVVMIVW